MKIGGWAGCMSANCELLYLYIGYFSKILEQRHLSFLFLDALWSVCLRYLCAGGIILALVSAVASAFIIKAVLGEQRGIEDLLRGIRAIDVASFGLL